MVLNFTLFLNRFVRQLLQSKVFVCFVCICMLSVSVPAKAFSNIDSSNTRRPSIISDLTQCHLPASMVTRIRHMSPTEIPALDEEFQQTEINADGEESVITVKLRFIDDHITGYIKQAPLNNSSQVQSTSYIDIPVEWMCIPPSPDHPFHFATSINDIKAIQDENCCLDWVQRDSDVEISFAPPKTKKKLKLFAKNK